MQLFVTLMDGLIILAVPVCVCVFRSMEDQSTVARYATDCMLPAGVNGVPGNDFRLKK